jgi:hypothetical protein
MKEYVKARFLKFRNRSFSKDAVLEAPAAHDYAIQPCLITYHPGHFAEGGLQGKVEGKGELTAVLSCLKPFSDCPDHGREIKVNDISGLFDGELQDSAAPIPRHGFEFHRRLPLEGNLPAKTQDSGNTVEKPSQT